MASKGELSREKILDHATRVFHRKGFLSTTVNDLLDAGCITKGKLYFHFVSKEAVGLEVLSRARTSFRRFLADALQGETPGNRLERFFYQALDRNRSKGFVGGCLFGNTALEASDTAPEFSEPVSEVFREWIDTLRATIAAAQDSGEVRRDLPAAQLAELIVAAIEGGIMQSRLNKDPGPLTRTFESLRVLLELKPRANTPFKRMEDTHETH